MSQPQSFPPPAQTPGENTSAQIHAVPPAATLAVVLAGLCGFLNLYATQPLLPLFASIFHASKIQVSFTVTAATAGVAIAAPFAGRLADRFGRKPIILSSAWALGASTCLAATSPNLTLLIFWRFVQGFVTPGVFAVTVAYINDEWPIEQAASAIGAYVSGTIVGGFAGRVIAGWAAEHFGWRWAFLVPGFLLLASCFVLTLALPNERRFVRPHKTGSLFSQAARHLRNPHLLATNAIGFCVLFTLLAMFTYATFHLAGPPFFLKPAMLGSMFVVYLVGAVVTPVSGRWTERHGHRWGLLLSSGLSIAGAALTLVPNTWIILVGLAVCCSGVFIAQTAATSFIGLAAQQNRALAVGLYVTFYYVGGTFGGTLPGWAWDKAGWPGCVAMVIFVQIVLLAIAQFAWPPKAQTSRAPSLERRPL